MITVFFALLAIISFVVGFVLMFFNIQAAIWVALFGGACMYLAVELPDLVAKASNKVTGSQVTPIPPPPTASWPTSPPKPPAGQKEDS